MINSQLTRYVLNRVLVEKKHSTPLVVDRGTVLQPMLKLSLNNTLAMMRMLIECCCQTAVDT